MSSFEPVYKNKCKLYKRGNYHSFILLIRLFIYETDDVMNSRCQAEGLRVCVYKNTFYIIIILNF